MDPLSALVKSQRAILLKLCGPVPKCSGESANRKTGTENAMDKGCKEMEIRDHTKVEQRKAGQLWRTNICSFAKEQRDCEAANLTIEPGRETEECGQVHGTAVKGAGLRHPQVNWGLFHRKRVPIIGLVYLPNSNGDESKHLHAKLPVVGQYSSLIFDVKIICGNLLIPNALQSHSHSKTQVTQRNLNSTHPIPVG
jgi:hypothetical protein